MGREFVDRCGRCGKAVIKTGEYDSSDMIQAETNFLYLCDTVEDMFCRPSLKLRDKDENLFCPDCLLEVIEEWIGKIKAMAPSNIPPENIVLYPPLAEDVRE